MTKLGLGRLCAAGAIVALCGTAVTAYDYDPTGKAGNYNTSRPAVLVKGSGGTFANSNVFAPYILDEDDGQFNAAAIQVINGRPVSVVTTFRSGADLVSRAVSVLGTTDDPAVPAACGFPMSGPFASNDVLLDELTATSNSLGTFLADGTVVVRENFAGISQNNIGVFTGITNIAGQNCAPGEDAPFNVFSRAFCGIDNGPFPGVPSGSAFLGTPGALREPVQGNLWTGVTTFDGGTGCSPNGTGVWSGFAAAPGGAANPNAPLALWLQILAPVPVTVPVTNPDEIRQTQPVLRTITTPSGSRVPYQIHGVGVSPDMVSPSPISGGSARPVYFVVDEISGGGGFDADTVYVEADKLPGVQAGNRIGDPNFDIAGTTATTRFIDHQATGGGASPFVNSQFDMNERGEIVTLWEDLNSNPRVTQVRLYRPIWNMANTRIIGYRPAIVIADNVADPFLVDTLQTTGAAPGFAVINFVPFSGVSISNDGRIAYSAVTESFVALRDVDMMAGTPPTPVLLNTTNGLYVYEPGTMTTHEVLRGGQTGDTLLDTSAAMPKDLILGFFPVDTNSDAFNREGFSDDGTSLVVNFRDGGNENATDQDMDMFADVGGTLKTRGTPAMMGEQSVRGTVVVRLGQFTVAPPACPGDVDGDGAVGISDIAGITLCWNQPAACNPGADLDDNGIIDLADLSVVILNWGTVCP